MSDCSFENLIKETLSFLDEHKKSPADVLWVGSADGKYALTWAQFVLLFADFTYNGGFGPQIVADDLVVVGNNWWLERREYDGAEHWHFSRKPRRRRSVLPFIKIDGIRDTLQEIQEDIPHA